MVRRCFWICLSLAFGLCFGASGGPDEFGYRWVDSDEPGGPAFEWIEISSTGEVLSLHCDDCTDEITLSAPFEFYGDEYTHAKVSSNGYISFDLSMTWYPITVGPFPDPFSPNLVIAPYNMDLNPSLSPGDIYFQDFGDKAVIEWKEIREYGSSATGTSTFEVILHYGRREIIFQYLETRVATHTAYVGIEDASGSVGLNVWSWSSDPPDSYAIRLRATPVATPPYGCNFEIGCDDFSFPGTTGWEWGILPTSSPAFPPSTGVKCVATVLAGDYSNNADWVFETPHIDATTITWPIVDFWHYYDCEEGHDGGVVEVSTDDGASWVIVEPEDGYPTTMTTGPLAGMNAFSGSSGGWHKVSFDLSDYAGQEFVMRFHFISDDANTGPGWYIDDFGYHQAYGFLHGYVDLGYFEPDSGALVEIVDLGRSTLTDTSGYFVFDSVDVGEHYLRISRPHFVTRDSIYFSMARFDTVYLEVLLAPELYSEDFEEGNGDMAADPVDGWQWGRPDSLFETGPAVAHSGTLCWGTNLAGNYSNNADWKLVVQVPLYEVRWPLLSFYTWYKFNGEWAGMLYDGGNVKVSVDSGATWQIVYPVEGYDGIVGAHNDYLGSEPAFGGMENGNYWHEVHFPLYDFAGSPVIWVMFELGSDGAGTAAGWYIDDVRLAEDSTYAGVFEGTAVPAKPLLAVAPNPFNAACRISYVARGGVISILDLTGRCVARFELSGKSGRGYVVWDAAGCPSGVYTVKLSAQGAETAKRVILVR